MAILKVAVMGNPILRKVAEKVPPEEITTPAFQAFLQDMLETMIEYDGRGLAAPQVHVSKQVLIMLWDFDAGKDTSVLCLINPEIEPLTKNTSEFWEGCLSVPGLRGKVVRPNKIRVRALDGTGKPLDFVAEGFAATVVQHECDHLQGKLYVDRITDLRNLSFNREYERFIAPEE